MPFMTNTFFLRPSFMGGQIFFLYSYVGFFSTRESTLRLTARTFSYCDLSWMLIRKIKPEPSGNPLGSAYISQYIPPFITIRIQYCNQPLIQAVQYSEVQFSTQPITVQQSSPSTCQLLPNSCMKFAVFRKLSHFILAIITWRQQGMHNGQVFLRNVTSTKPMIDRAQ